MSSLAEINDMILELSKLENEADRIRGEAKKVNETIDEVKAKLMGILQDANLKTFKSNWGTITVAERFTVKFPKDDEGKKALKDYLQEKNIFDQMWGINYQSLNSWYKNEVEAAKQAGEYIDVPSLEPSVDYYLSFRTK
jgi:hypothetical protein